MAPWFPQTLTTQTKNTLTNFKKAPELLKEFYLAGGTALALQLGHRVSVDLDFFSSTNHLTMAQLEHLKSQLRQRYRFEIRQEEEGTLHLTIDKTLTSFFRYNYPLIKGLLTWEGISIASVEDIALMKLGALISRGAKKDFVDLYTICQKNSLKKLCELAEKKFPDASDFLLQAARALVYFEDAEKDPMPRLLKPIDWRRVKTFFEKETRRLLKSCLKN